MHVQNSYQKSEKGVLYIVPTPIGNLDDMTFRAIDTLKQVDTILAEDTRHTQKLLQHFKFSNTLLSFHEHNKEGRVLQIMENLKEGQNFALVSDAGMPAISDPGYDLVRASIEADVSVIVLPGATAAICALVGSGLPTDEFLFYGFLPRKNQEKKREVERLSGYQATVILYESPFRVKDTVQLISKYVESRTIVIAREMTKIYEQYVRGTCEEIIAWLDKHPLKGECCILIEGIDEEVSDSGKQWWHELTLVEHVKHYETTKEMSNKMAMKQVAKDRNISKRTVYQAVHIQ